jgi:hypothetical protein
LKREILFSLISGDAQMKRIVPIGLSAFAVAVLLGVTGCDSGGIETGVPADTTQGVPADKLPKLSPINPPGVKLGEGKGAITPTAPTATPEASKGATPK